jgi:hypothetical protein
MKVTEDFYHAVDSWRREQPGFMSRSQAVRVLVSKGLETDEHARA